MSDEKERSPATEESDTEGFLAPVRYSLPRMLAEVARDRESVREGGKLLNQEQIGAVFSSHREKGRDD